MTNKNFITICENVGSNIQDTSTAMQTIIKRLANQIYFDILRRTNFEQINDSYSLTATSSTAVLPYDFKKELAVYDNTNKVPLTRTNVGKEVDNSVSNIDEYGSLDRYSIVRSSVRFQPTSASIVTFSSSSASDNTQTVFVRGELLGVPMYETVTLLGTSPAVTTNQFDRIVGIGKSAVTAGAITATTNSAAVTVAIMSQEQLVHNVNIIKFYPAPSKSTSVGIPYIIDPMPMVSDYDYPLIDCSDCIEYGATSRALMYKRQFAKAADFNKLYEQQILLLIWDKENQPNDIHIFDHQSYSRDNV